MIERDVLLETMDGTMDAFSCCPEEGGPFPAVLFYMDAPAIREELRDMARRLATTGYFVLLPNLFYRHGTEGNYPFDTTRIRIDDDEFRKMQETMAATTNARIVGDTRAMLDHVRASPATLDGPVAALGYCMSGQYVVSVLAEYPDDFACGASFYGVGIATDDAESPHRKVERIKGELYLAFAETDRWVTDDLYAKINRTFTSAPVQHRVEMYPGTEHGFAFPLRYCYDKAAAERHWERIFALLRRRLPPPGGS